MRRHLFDVGLLFIIATAVAVYFFIADPGWHSVVVRAYLFVLGGLAMIVLVSAAGDALPRQHRSAFEQALARSDRPPVKVTDLERVQREVTLAVSSAHDLHTKLAPHLREIAQARLERSGRRLDAETAGEWWELLRPDREPPDDKFASGIKLAELRRCLDDLARIS